MAKEKQLGPGVTYRDLDRNAPVVVVAGVRFEDGETVDLVDELGEGRAQPLLRKLAGNHFFDVENSGAEHEEVRERVARESGADRRKPAARKPAIKKSVAKRIEREDAENKEAEPEIEPETEPELPGDVQTPDEPTLENKQTGGRPRLPRARR